MSECCKCEFSELELKNNLECDIFGGTSMSYTITPKCSENKMNELIDKESECLKYSELKCRCLCCGKLKLVSKLHDGFCSEKCKRLNIKRRKESLLKEELRAFEIRDMLDTIDRFKEIYDQSEVVVLQSELNDIMYGLDEERFMLSWLEEIGC